MEFIQNRMTKKSYVTILAIFIGFFLFHLTISLTHVKDDQLLFFEPLTQTYHGNYIAFLTHRYATWSSRLVIETFTLFSVTHFMFWRVANALMMTIASILPVFFVIKQRQILPRDLIFSTALFLLIPLSLFYDTGWIATSTNYLWVYATALVASYSVWRILHHRFCWFEYSLGILASIYATNHEQMLALFGTYLGLAILYLIIRLDWHVIKLLPFVVITTINGLVIALAPGNHVRYTSEVKQWFPDYETLSLFRKLELGFSSTTKHLFFDQLALPIVLLIVLLIGLQVRSRVTIMDRIVSILPLALSLGLTYNLFMLVPPAFRDFFFAQFNQYGTTFEFRHLTTWIPDILLLLIVLGILYSLYRIPNSLAVKVQLGLVFCAAIVVRMVLAFSPTIWASSGRTYLFTLGLFTLLTVYLVDTFMPERSRHYLYRFTILLACLFSASQLYLLFTS